jgi:hypothetical protein
MALVTEDGTGKTDAESYISVAAADAYHLIHSISSTWAAATTAVKEAALRQAAQYLDTTYKDKWKGFRADDDQALDWPREGLVIDGVVYDSADLPTQLLEAAAELALKVVDGDVIFADMDDEGSVKSRSVRVGPITEAVSFSGSSRGIKRYRLVEGLVAPLIEMSNTVSRS